MNFFNDLKNIEKRKINYYDELIKGIKRFPKIALYGIGESCTEALKFFKHNNININVIYDDNLEQNNTYYDNILVTLPDYNDKNSAIVVTCSFYSDIRKKLYEYDNDIDKRLFLFDGYFLENIDYNFFLKNKNKILYCYDKLEDKSSKLLYEKVLEYRYVRDKNIIKDFVETNRGYFDNVFLDKFEQGTIIDAGAYIGSFEIDLSKLKDTSNSMFYLFEPNKTLYDKIDNNLKTNSNYKIFPYALCDTNGNLEFTYMPTSTSHLMQKKYSSYNTFSNNIEIVETRKLDDVIKNENITLIKVDIEGSELSFLKGAKNTIVNNKPILLLSAYHKTRDLWELLYYIDKLNLGYKFYLHHYSLSVAKTILYCIPN